MEPSRAVVCGQGNVLEQLAQNVTRPLGAGHIDSASASYCTVPTTAAWLLALAAFILCVWVGTILARKGDTKARPHA